MPVAVFRGTPDRPRAFMQVEGALALIDRHQAGGVAALRQYIPGILVFGTQGHRLAHWSMRTRRCVLTEPYVISEGTTPEHIALTLVHEAMHSRLRDLGEQYRDGRRAHVEALCHMAELALARRLPGCQQLVAQAERQLEAWARGGEDDLSNEAQYDADVDHVRTMARDLGVPQWVVSAVVALKRAFSRRAA